MGQNTAILDIGSSKVICLICGTDGRDNILVQGAGIKEYPGYKHGAFEDEQQLADAIIDALSAAEAEARHRVRDISVGVPAPFTKLVLQQGEVNFKGKQRRITHRDIDDVINASLDFAAPDGYSLIHSTPVEFTVQGAVRSDMPIGVMAEGFSAKVSHLYVDNRFKQLVSDALLRVGLDADMYIAVPLSEGVFVIPENERSEGAVLIDSGATHTDVSLVKNAALMDMRTIAVGGAHFTSDLGYGIGIKEAVAEPALERLAAERRLPFMVTYTYTGHHMFRRMRALISSGALGKIRKVMAEYPQSWLADEHSDGGKQGQWRMDPKQSGGKTVWAISAAMWKMPSPH